MNSPIPQREKKGNAWSVWILRLALGAALIGVSVWGIDLCRGIFRSSVGPEALPADSAFSGLATWAAWALFFAPLAIGGVALIWSTLRRMGAIYEAASWMEDRVGPRNAMSANSAQFGGIVRGGTPDDPHGLESLSAETVQRLQHTATRAATILGGLTGAFLLGIGIFGLGYLLISSRTDTSNPIYGLYGHFAVGRAMASFALLSSMLVLLGLTILQQTFRRDNGSWLLPLRLFTYIVLKRRASERKGIAQQSEPGTKQLPRA